MERRLAESQAVAVGERSRLARPQSHGLVDDRAVDAPQIFEEERVALAPDARVAARDFRLRVEARKIYVGEDVRLRVCATDEVHLLVENKRRVEFRGSGDDEARGRARRTQRRARGGDGLARAAVRAEHILRGDRLPAEAAEDALDG